MMDPKDIEGDGDGYSYAALMMRDRRRWSHADEDNDDALNRTEFRAFLHPEDHPLMKDIIVLETLEDIDKDKVIDSNPSSCSSPNSTEIISQDGKVSLKEYIGDMYKADEDGEEPEWVQSERDQFNQYR